LNGKIIIPDLHKKQKLITKDEVLLERWMRLMRTKQRKKQLISAVWVIMLTEITDANDIKRTDRSISQPKLNENIQQHSSSTIKWPIYLRSQEKVWRIGKKS
jgi:hypothetical protein